MTPEQLIRSEFLKQACEYLFGRNTACATLLRQSLGLPALQPIPLRAQR